MKNIKHLYVSQLQPSLQYKIEKELILFYEDTLELNTEDLTVELELAMNSRVSDLADTIDLTKILD